MEYLYDDAYQLTGEVRTGGNAYSQYFEYDPSGNRTRSSLDGTATTYLYNEADQLTSETTSGVTTTYLYDANGAQTKAVDSTTTKYSLDGNDVVADYDGSDTLLATYVTPALDTHLSMTSSQSFRSPELGVGRACPDKRASCGPRASWNSARRLRTGLGGRRSVGKMRECRVCGGPVTNEVCTGCGEPSRYCTCKPKSGSSKEQKK